MICTTWETPSVGSITLLLLQISFSVLLKFFSFNPIAIWAFGIPDFSVARIAKSTQNTPGVTRKVLGPGRWSRWRLENLLHPHSPLLHLHPFLHCRKGWRWMDANADHADSDPGQTVPSQKGGFWHLKKWTVPCRKCVINHIYVGTGTVQKPFWKDGNQAYLLIILVNITLLRISIPNTDPDPGEPNQCGSGSKTPLFL